MKLHIINGPNLNLLGIRETEIYGHVSFEDYLIHLRKKFPDHELEFFQSNHEGALIDKLQEIGFSADGIIFNPAAYTHTSIALSDTVKTITSPVVEVHISNIYERESFRHHSYITKHVLESVIGKGLKGYELAIEILIK